MKQLSWLKTIWDSPESVGKKVKQIICGIFGHKWPGWWEGYKIMGRECRRCEKIEIKPIYDTV